MKHRYAQRLISGVVMASLVVTSSMTLFAEDLETEIPSAGAAVIIDEYIETAGSDEDLLSMLPKEQTYVKSEKKSDDETVTDKSTEDTLFDDIAITSVSGGKEDYVNVRKKNTTKSKSIGKIYNNCGGYIKETTSNGWYKVKSGNCVGYIKADFFVTGSQAKAKALDNGYVIADIKDALHVRKQPNKDADLVTNVYKNEHYVVKKFDGSGQWIKIKIGDGVSGWISADYASISVDMDTAKTNKEIKEEQRRIREAEEAARKAAQEAARQAANNNNNNRKTNTNNNTNNNTNHNTNTNTNTNSGSSNTQSYGDNGSGGASNVVAYAKQFLGNPYVYGGSSLTGGTDCSGFTMSIYAHFGYSLNRVSAEQAKNGRAVSMSSLQPGDLLFYSYGGGRISHVAMYIGGGQIIHASTESTGIIISGMGSPCAARRIIG